MNHQREILDPRRIRAVKACYLNLPPIALFCPGDLLDAFNGPARNRIDGMDDVEDFHSEWGALIATQTQDNFSRAGILPCLYVRGLGGSISIFAPSTLLDGRHLSVLYILPPVTATEIIALATAAAAAGMVNSIAGGGTLITFPVLLLFGTPEKVANATSTLALVLGMAGSLLGYRNHLAAARIWLWRFVPVSILGGLLGSVLLDRKSVV